MTIHLLAFQEYSFETGKYVFYPTNEIFTNFIQFINDFLHNPTFLGYYKRGLPYYFVGIIMGQVSMMLQYIIYKKRIGYNLFKIVLFLPTVLSSTFCVIVFKYFTDRAMPVISLNLFGKSTPLLWLNDEYNNIGLMIYTVLFAIPGGLLLNLSTMNRIPPEIIESAELDGITAWKEYWHIVFPYMYPIIQIAYLTVFTGLLLGGDGPLYVMYGGLAPENTKTLCYHLFNSVLVDGPDVYGYQAALNLSVGLISIPIIMGTKKLLDRFDPEAEV